MRMYLLTFQCVLLAIHLALPGVQSFRWLAVKKPDSGKWSSLCPRRPRDRRRVLVKDQLKMCRKRPTFMKYVAEAAALAIQACQNLTYFERWNCKSLSNAPKFSKDLRDGTKESSFVHALSTAALVFRVTLGCMSEESCKCGKIPKQKIPERLKSVYKEPLQWADECHDNIARGIRYSEEFLDAKTIKQKKSENKVLLILHNNDVGRQAVRESMTVDCKCVGQTGSCPIRVCIRRLPVDFHVIAKDLFKRYKAARQVHLVQVTASSKKLVPKSRGRNKKPRKLGVHELIYLHRSRNFCRAKRNLPGTVGRECWRTDKDVKPSSCDYLCCNRGHVTKKSSKTEMCKLRWDMKNMRLKIKYCERTVKISYCR